MTVSLNAENIFCTQDLFLYNTGYERPPATAIKVHLCEVVGFVTLLRNVDCDDCLAANPAFTVS